MKKFIIILLAILVGALGFQQFADRAVAPSPENEAEASVSSQGVADSSEGDGAESESGSVRSLPTAESIRSLADEYEKRIEADQ